jgi:hypothetical protein
MIVSEKGMRYICNMREKHIANDLRRWLWRSLTSFTTHGFATTSVFAVLFLRKAFGMVTINGTFVFQGPFVSFYCHFLENFAVCFFNIYYRNF